METTNWLATKILHELGAQWANDRPQDVMGPFKRLQGRDWAKDSSWWSDRQIKTETKLKKRFKSVLL